MSKKNRKKRPAQGDNGTPLARHKRVGSQLVPPLAQIPNSLATSWIDDRLPEVLWATLLITHLKRDVALGIFRSVGNFCRTTSCTADVSHTALSGLARQDISSLLRLICPTKEARYALSPLLLFPQLPAYENWCEVLGFETSRLAWDLLATSVMKTLDHQSQEATDCRWLKVIIPAICGKLIFREGKDEQLVKELAEYPYYGDPCKVRPSVRSLEMFSAPGVIQKDKTVWPTTFWTHCLTETGCEVLRSSKEAASMITTPNSDDVSKLQESLCAHFMSTISATTADAKHDTVFGLAAYALQLLHEALLNSQSGPISSRLVVRSLTECLINLAYLHKRNDPELWDNYRRYGSGRAKLSFLKLQDAEHIPRYVSVDLLERLANEDTWQEFVKIELGHWAKSDLRKMSIDSGTKDWYDKYYEWSSAFSHGQWGAIREVCFEQCYNPLHKYHRILGGTEPLLPQAYDDAIRICNATLDLVNEIYPGFWARA